VVSALSEAEAIDIALESLPKGSRAAETTATYAEATYGPDSWLVKVKFVRDDVEGEY